MMFSCAPNSEPPCPKCGAGYLFVSTPVQRDGVWVDIRVCEQCLLKAALGAELFEKEVRLAVTKEKESEEIRWLGTPERKWWEFWK